jgi:hypothetical protein
MASPQASIETLGGTDQKLMPIQASIHELPHVIWGLRTQPSKATGQTPFFLVYGSEAILPAYIM